MLHPTKNNLIVKPMANEETTKSGIMVVQTQTREAPMFGKIISKGVDVEQKGLKKGLTIIFKKFAGDEIKENDETLLIINEDDIIAYED